VSVSVSVSVSVLLLNACVFFVFSDHLRLQSLVPTSVTY